MTCSSLAGCQADQYDAMCARRARLEVLGDGERLGARERANDVTLQA
jgi:hypothetical protein